MKPTPQTKAKALIDRVNGLLRRGKPTTFEIASIKRETRQLLSADAASAYMVLGALGVLEKDEAQMHANHQRALALLPGDFLTHLNYAISLENLGLYTESLKYVRTAAKLNEGNPDILEKHLNIAKASGRFKEAHSVLGRLDAMRPREAQPDADFVRKATRILEKHGISEDDSELFFRAAEDVLRQHGIYDPSVDYRVSADDEIVATFKVAGDLEAIDSLNCELIDKVVGLDISPQAQLHLVAGFVATDEAAEAA